MRTRMLALALAPVLLFTGLPHAASAAPARSGKAPAVRERPKPRATAMVPGRRTARDEAAAAAVTAPPPVRWPAAGEAAVDLTGGAKAVSVGGLPVSLRAAEPATRAFARAASGVRIAVADRAATRRAGVQGLVLTAGPTGAGTRGPVTVDIGYAGFADAFGGDYGARLRLVRLPACALSTPERHECQRQQPLRFTNDSGHRRLATTVDTAGGAVVLAAVAGDESSQGSYAATKLAASSKWDVSLASGALTWNYPLRNPPTPGGLVPQVAFGYSSQGVDGRTSSTNNQGSWIGEGFSYEPGYVERRYKPCEEDGHDHYGDQCWAFANASLTLSGHSGDLVKVNDNLWKLSSDDGTKVERLRSAGNNNGDDDGEHWKATTTDGTQYFFGMNRLPGWSANKEETNSTWTVPISGDDVNEPCHDSSGWTDSFCDQGWRWNLDYVKDVHGNVIAYYYGKEVNHYARTAKTDVNGSMYVRAGYLRRIDYGQADGAVYTTAAPARISFEVAERCLPSGSITCADSQFTEDNAAHWPDVPVDRHCAANTHCKVQQSTPTFWTRKRLKSVTTEIREGSAWKPVERWTLTHSFTDNGDGSRTLWLGRIDHAGLYGGTEQMPPVRLLGIQLPNRIDTDTDMLAPLIRYRLSTIYTDTGAEVQVNYAPANCGPGNLPSEGSSTRRCYPVRWNPFGTDDDLTDWFHKYVVAELIQLDPTGGNPPARTTYEYLNKGFGNQDGIEGAAWRKAAPDGITPEEDLTWSVWRGYPKVTVRTGDLQTLTTRVDHHFFRGMDGDQAPGGGTRSVKVTDHTGAVYTDSDELNGTELESVTYNGGQVISRKISQPKLWFTHTQTESWGTRKSSMLKVETERAFTALAPDAQGNPVWRETRTTSTYDQAWGRITLAEDLGDVSTPADDQCTRTEYVDNTSTSVYLYKFPKLNEKFSVRCADIGTADRATRLLSSERKLYDGAAYGVAPTKGDLTRLETLDSASGTTTTYLGTSTEVDAYGRPTKVTDPEGGVTLTSYVYTNGLSTRTTVTNSLGHSTVTDTLPAFGAPVAVTDENLRRTDLAYDPLGRLTSVWLANRPKAQGFTPNTKYSYHVHDDRPSVVTTEKVRNDGTYAVTHQLLDSALRVRQEQSQGPGGGWLLRDTTYAPTGEVAVRTDYYLALGTGGGAVLVVPEGSTNGATRYLYDGAGRVTDEIFTVAGDERYRTRTSYDGAKTSTIPPDGGIPRSTVVDGRGRTVELHEYSGATPAGPSRVTRYTFAPNGKLDTVTDAEGNVWTHAYDQRGNLIRLDDPDAGRTTFTYDRLNRLTSTRDARHVVTSYVYDKLGRKTEQWQGQPVTGTKLSSWTYDTFYKGQLSGHSRFLDGAAYHVTYPQRDNLYNPLKTSYVIPAAAGTELARTYDFTLSYNADGTVQGVGNPAAGGLPAENVVTTYDPLQRPLSLTGLTPYVVHDGQDDKTRYDDLGQLLQLTLWNGTGKKAWQTFTYERGTNRLTGIRLDRQDAPAVDMDAHYGYDDAGNVLSISDTPAGGPVDTQCFAYDGYRQLTQAWSTTVGDPEQCAAGPGVTGVGGPAPYRLSWTFDAVGLRTSETTYSTSGAGTTRTYHYPAPGAPRPHALASTDQAGADATTYTYDARGSLLTRTTPTRSESFAWNAEGRLDTYSTGGQDTTFVYDAEGARLVKKEPGATTLYLGAMQLRLDHTTRVVAGTRFYSFGDRAVATRTTTGVSYTVSDRHNTNSCAIDADTGAITWRRTLPYGSVRGAAPASWPDDRGFLGAPVDANGLVHLGAREYDPAIGRFISVDTLLDLNDPGQINGYSYAANSPVTSSDPSGTRIPDEDCRLGGCDRTPSAAPSPADSPAKPPTCAPGTPEYCHWGGSNLHTPVTLFAQWAYQEALGCDGPTYNCYKEEFFRDGDPFTQDIQRLVTIDEARKAVELALAQGDSEGRAHFHLGNKNLTAEERKTAALNNALGILTFGRRGMQHSLAFLGSYDLEWRNVGHDGNGNPVIEFHLTNASTKASASLAKGKVADYGPDQCAGCGADAAAGEHYTKQSVRWRETFVGGKANLVHDFRFGGGELGIMRPTRRDWNLPTERDPLVGPGGYGALEWGIKGGLGLKDRIF